VFISIFAARLKFRRMKKSIVVKRHPEHQRRCAPLDEAAVGRASSTGTVLAIVVCGDILGTGARDRQRMRGVDASHYAGLSSENLGEEATLGGCYPGVKQRPGFIWRRRIAISVRGEAERVAEFAEHTKDAVRAVREAPATRKRAVHKQNFGPTTCDLLKGRAQRIWPDRRRDLAPQA
jgi:hypothetical protein